MIELTMRKKKATERLIACKTALRASRKNDKLVILGFKIITFYPSFLSVSIIFFNFAANNIYLYSIVSK